MSNPFLKTTTSNAAVDIKVNNKKPNYLNNIVINISDIPNLQDEIQKIDYIVVSDPQNDETLIFNSISQKFENETMPHLIHLYRMLAQ